MALFSWKAKVANTTANNANKAKFPAHGDVFRSVSFGMTEAEYQTAMRHDEQIMTDNTHAHPIFKHRMFGSEFMFNPKYLDGELFRLTLYSDTYGYYSEEVREIHEAVISMFTEKFGESTPLGDTVQRYAGSKVWDFNGKTIEVALMGCGKYGQYVGIIITSTAMEAEAKALRKAAMMAKCTEYSADF